jgi:N-acetylmuramoyl-L-alanine amidase
MISSKMLGEWAALMHFPSTRYRIASPESLGSRGLMKIPTTRFLLVICTLALASVPSLSSHNAEAGSGIRTNSSALHQLSNDQATKPCVPDDFRIAIDVGHTIEASGALSARGVTEYSFNLRLAKRIEETLRRAGYMHTYVLVTRGIGNAQLTQRSARANSLKTDLFLSVHHDDVQPIYYEKSTYNGGTYHFSDRFSGYSLFVSYRNQFPAESLDFAKLLGAELTSRGMKFSSHHSENIPGERRQILDPERGVYRYDQLMVLKNTKAPAVLLEAGIIVNREEELVLSSSDRQQLISEAVLAATSQFCGGTRPSQELQKH